MIEKLRSLVLLSLAVLFVEANVSAEPLPYLEVRDDGLVAHVYRPAGDHAKAPTILLLGGSGGGIGWQDEMAKLLSERGFVVMALGYFAMDGLPKELERIPLEYFDRAISWLFRQPYVDTKRIGIGGVSKGSELALLIASRHPEVRAVAAFVPSGVVFQSIAEGYPRTSSWSLEGKDVPFVPYGRAENPRNIIEYYRSGLEQSDAVEAATIPVERINGPILLLSGEGDNLWPSTMLSEMIVTRLRKKDFAHPVEHVAYPDAGHLISSIRNDDVTRRGGTVDGNSKAQVDGQRRFLAFFDEHLKARK